MFGGGGVLAEHFRRPRGAFAERRILLINAQLLKLMLLLGAAAQQKARSDAGGCEYLFHCCDSSVVRGGKSPARRLYAILPCIITAMFSRRITVVAALALCAAAVSSCGGKAAVDAKDYSLHEAAAAGDVAVIKHLVAGGADVNRRVSREFSVNSPQGNYRWAPLHYAAANNHEEAVYTLINSGAVVNLKDKYGYGDTPLHVAARFGNADAAAALIRGGAELNMHNRGQRTPLEVAIEERGGKDATAIFLEHAAKHYDKEAERIARQLLQRSKKPIPPPVSPFVDCADWAAEVLGEDGKPAEHLELTNSCLVMKSTDGFDTATAGASGEKYTSLHGAVKADDVAKIKELIADGADFNQGDSEGLTPLHVAALFGHVAAIDTLASAGADVNNNDNVSGQTPLHIAAKAGQVAAINVLVNAGANVNKGGNDGRAPLYAAARHGHAAAINALVKSGANINQGVTEGLTPLHFAAYEGHVAAIDALVKAGADVNQVSSGGTPLIAAILNGHIAATDALIKAGADVNKVDDDGGTPLIGAIFNGHAAIVNALIKAGVNVNRVDDNGGTPLIAAILSGHANVVDALIKAGANVNQRHKEEFTPLHFAVYGQHRRYRCAC